MTNQIVIVLGNDHTNTLGVVQCLGREGYNVVVFMWGTKTGIVNSSRYIKFIYTARDIQECIDLIILKYNKSSYKIPIIPCCDLAALFLEKNSSKLNNIFLFGYATNYSLLDLSEKENQVKLAKESGFNVPKTWRGEMSILKELQYPCIIKPLISCKGAKSDIRVCKSELDFLRNIKDLHYTSRSIIQQYIEKDFEISILGCALKNGKVIIPCVENKLTLYPKNVGLECLVNLQPLNDFNIITNIESLIHKIGYVGVFSVEMMHSKFDDKFYFTEINLRNDGANALIYKYGVNLPLNHIEDLMDRPLTIFKNYKPGFYIWDMHHFLSLIHCDINPFKWINDLRKSQGLMCYFSDDKRPFYKQYTNWILSKFHLLKNEQY